MFRILLVAGCLVFSGCTTLKDFEAMSPQQRADFVCVNEPDIKQFAAEMSGYRGRIAEINQAIERGYRVHVSCHYEAVEVCETVDHDHARGGTDGKRHHHRADHAGSGHSHEHKTEWHKVCIETPVAIDGQLERDKKADYRNLLNVSRAAHHEAFMQCHERVRPMSAGEAYSYYQH